MEQREEILGRLFARTTKGIKLGLDRVKKAVSSVGDPQNCYKVVHVAGTNGKGSVCAFIEAMLHRSGVRTGLFTSPHIIRFEERICINGGPVKTEAWRSVYGDLEGLIDKYNLTFFEATTLIAFELFRRGGVEWAVIETGLGGRLDATNIVIPEAAVITAMGIDHAEYLGGEDPVKIAGEKLGIVKQGVPLYMEEPENAEIGDLAATICAEKGAPLCMVSRQEVSGLEKRGHGSVFSYKGISFKVPLFGEYQVLNALCAIKTFESLGAGSLQQASEGLACACVPGRFQICYCQGRTVIFDVGHNAQSAGFFAEAAREFAGPERICIIAGIMRDKQIAEMMALYCGVAAGIILCRPKVDRAAPAEMLLSNIPSTFRGEKRVVGGVGEAVRWAVDRWEGIVCVTGSFYTVGEAMAALGIEPYQEM